MKKLALNTVLASLFLLSACDVTGTNEHKSEARKSTADRIKASSSGTPGPEAITDLSELDIPDIIHFVDREAKEMTALLKTVTDGASAEAAVEDIRETIPRLNAGFSSMSNLDQDNLNLSIGSLRKLLTISQFQSDLFEEVRRIGQIPEARAMLEKEFDKIKITGK